MKISQLKSNPSNPRLIKNDKFEKLVKSIESFPEMMAKRPMVCVTDTDGKIYPLGGNMRLKALQELKFKEIPDSWVILADEWTEEKRREFVIKDNVGFGEWDWDLIANEWPTEQVTEWGLDIPNFDPTVLEAQEDDFEAPEGGIETDIVLGDLFEIGEHRLLCGDSTDTDLVEKLMNGEKADMVFTDPPYGVSIGKKNKMLLENRKSKSTTVNLSDIESDDKSPSELKETLLPIFINYNLFMKDCCAIYVTSPQGGDLMMMMMMMMEAGLKVRHILIWVKNAATFSMNRLDYDYQHEPILFTWKKTHKKNKREGEFNTSVWTVDKPHLAIEHPTMKPIKLIENALLNSCDEKDLVIDYFLGSGSTMVAAHQLNRKCYGMELEPKYCQVIIDRMKKLDSDLVIKKNGENY